MLIKRAGNKSGVGEQMKGLRILSLVFMLNIFLIESVPLGLIAIIDKLPCYYTEIAQCVSLLKYPTIINGLRRQCFGMIFFSWGHVGLTGEAKKRAEVTMPSLCMYNMPYTCYIPRILSIQQNPSKRPPIANGHCITVCVAHICIFYNL